MTKNPKHSDLIIERLKKLNIPFKANDNIADYLTDEDRKEIRKEVEIAFKDVLKALIIDCENDPNTVETAKRVAKMYVEEVFAGRYQAAPKATDFPNSKELDGILIVSTTIRSTCSHHFAPILGKAWIGVIPGKRVIGISKFNRLADWVCSRPQIQEESAVQIADLLEEKIEPKGIAVVVKASHTCMTWRGVKDTDAVMTTSVMRGVFKADREMRREFLSMIDND